MFSLFPCRYLLGDDDDEDMTLGEMMEEEEEEEEEEEAEAVMEEVAKVAKKPLNNNGTGWCFTCPYVAADECVALADCFLLCSPKEEEG